MGDMQALQLREPIQRVLRPRLLLREIGCAVAKAHALIHLKGGVALTH
jgi:hypothetical protein